MALPGVYAFEEIDDALPLVPLAARRALDAAGWKLSLAGWVSLPVARRVALVHAGTGEVAGAGVGALVEGAVPPAEPLAVPPEPDRARVPPALSAALGPSRPLDDARWASLASLDRFALARYAGKPEKLAFAYDAIARPRLTHLDERGAAHMVDVGGKAETLRRAVASARVRTTPDVIAVVATGATNKGDVLAAARIAGVLASKRTADLIPLCHPVRTTRASIDFALDAIHGEVGIVATVEAVDRTGVEMEAMVAASIAALTIYDMIKSADRWAVIDAVRLDAKQGGKSGAVERPPVRA